MATADVESLPLEKVPADVRREPEVNKLFRMVMKHEGSDLHLKVGLPPCMRLAGVLRPMSLPPLTTARSTLSRNADFQFITVSARLLIFFF